MAYGIYIGHTMTLLMYFWGLVQYLDQKHNCWALWCHRNIYQWKLCCLSNVNWKFA